MITVERYLYKYLKKKELKKKIQKNIQNKKLIITWMLFIKK